MKVFSVFTKNGKVDIPIKDREVKEAVAIVKDPMKDLTEKVRELNDLSNKLVKVQGWVASNKIEKVVFKDVDGREMVIDKAWTDEAREASAEARRAKAGMKGKPGKQGEEDTASWLADALVPDARGDKPVGPNGPEVIPDQFKDPSSAVSEVSAGPAISRNTPEVDRDLINRQVGRTMMDQLGGNKFRAMTGANTFTLHDKAVSFRIPQAKDGINHVKVTLTPEDTYDVDFTRIRGTEAKNVKSVKGIYADQLRDVFTSHTGLDTSLGTMGKTIDSLRNLSGNPSRWVSKAWTAEAREASAEARRAGAKGKPEPGKQYALTGGKDDPSIMRGDTWGQSEVHPSGAVGEHEHNALTFAQKYPDQWHSHATDAKTSGAIRGLAGKGLVEHSPETNQFRYNTQKAPTEPVSVGRDASEVSPSKVALASTTGTRDFIHPRSSYSERTKYPSSKEQTETVVPKHRQAVPPKAERRKSIDMLRNMAGRIKKNGKDIDGMELSAMFDKEKKEHPSFTDEQVWRIVEDHLKEGKKD